MNWHILGEKNLVLRRALILAERPQGVDVKLVQENDCLVVLQAGEKSVKSENTYPLGIGDKLALLVPGVTQHRSLNEGVSLGLIRIIEVKLHLDFWRC